VLSFVGALVLAVLSYFEHMRSVRPSFLLNMYLPFTVLFDTARSRSYSMNPDIDTIATVFTSRVAVKLLLAIMEARPKNYRLLPEFADLPPEATSGPYKRALFWWINALFKKGYSNTLAIDDLFHLDKHLQADYLHHKLGSAWARCKRDISSQRPNSLTVSIQ
jgi:ATP-binding cassette subfamily C (CFTR/MRP) protein 1